MRVLSYIDSLNRGGMETLILDIAKNVTKNDFELIIVSGLGGDLENQFVKSNAVYIRLNRKYAFDIKVIRKLREIIRSEKIDMIHSHNDVSAFYGFISSIGLKIKRINSIHGYLSGKYDKTLYSFLINHSDRILTVSKSFSDKLAKDNNIKYSQVLYNGIDDKKFNFVKNRNSLNELNIISSDYIIGMIGNFSNGKDYWTLCQAIPLVLDKKPEVKFLFAGNTGGSNYNNYIKCFNFCKENGLLDNVFFLGKRDDIPEILNSLDLFVLSSNTDTFGIVVIEAMYSKVPCLLSDIPPLKEISENGKYAKLFKKGDYEKLAFTILQCIENPKELKTIKEEAYLYALRKFSISRHIHNLCNIYKDVLDI